MASRVMVARRHLGPLPLLWRLRTVAVCGSTEQLLSEWLQRDARSGRVGEPAVPRALLAAHQRFGHGQRGRPWSSPLGGVWLSAALPWAQPSACAASLSLAVAVGLAIELESLQLEVRIKWPNDLLVGGRKIAGLLPRLRHRGGAVVGARVGVGLNGCNRVPPGAISVASALGLTGGDLVRPAALAARVLRALEWAVAHAEEGEAVRAAAERRLLPGAEPLIEDGFAWEPVGLDQDGALRVRCDGRERRLLRRF